jgi:hypothetical protein
MQWTVLLADEFEPEFFELPQEVQDETLALTRLLQQFGPNLGRPRRKNCVLMRRMGSGVSHSPSIRSAGQFSWWRVTSPEEAKSASIDN